MVPTQSIAWMPIIVTIHSRLRNGSAAATEHPVCITEGTSPEHHQYPVHPAGRRFEAHCVLEPAGDEEGKAEH